MGCHFRRETPFVFSKRSGIADSPYFRIIGQKIKKIIRQAWRIIWTPDLVAAHNYRIEFLGFRFEPQLFCSITFA